MKQFLVLLLAASVSACSFVPLEPQAASTPGAQANQKDAPKGKQVVEKSKKTFLAAKKSTKLPEVKLVVNREVQKELDRLQGPHRMTTKLAIQNRSEHFDTMQQIFKDEGVPQDLVNVAFLESGFNQEAKSPAGATGMWQFMKTTAKYYGLKIGFINDDRKDVILSTLAAARHLRDLYANYNDWYLALAAYNIGTGGLERAMREGGTRDFWTLARKGMLPEETRRFVPKFVAAAMIMRDPEAYGFAADTTTVG